MEEKIFEAISGWASVRTWYTSHPLDEQRFYEAIENLVSTVGVYLKAEDFELALRRHAKSFV